MAIPKIMGIETEYGVTVKNALEQDPVTTSTLVVNSYEDRQLRKAIWDYDQENPLMDARGFQTEGENEPPDQENNSTINDILINGGRYYVDHAHPEYCTPECTNAKDLVRYDKAGELILDISRSAAGKNLPADQEILIYKNNSDRKGHSYGCHENYLMDRKTSFQDIIEGLMPFLISRQIFTGSGKIGSENGNDSVDYQISQRADFFETEVGLSTMVDRPIINTRDEPHADEKRFRRLHVIVGDANMSEFTNYLKVGTTAVVLALIEDGVIGNRFELQEPVKFLKEVSRDLSCKKELKLESGKKLTPVQMQYEYLNLAKAHLPLSELDPVTKDVLVKWEYTLDRLAEDAMLLDKHLDWVIKKSLIEAYMDRHKLDWKDHRIMMLDLQYHDIRPSKGLYYRLLKAGSVERIVTPSEIVSAISNPPLDTRAYFRGTCLKKYAAEVYGASWNSMIFDSADSSLDKIFMPDPSKGTKEIVGELLENCGSATELIKHFNQTD